MKPTPGPSTHPEPGLVDQAAQLKVDAESLAIRTDRLARTLQSEPHEQHRTVGATLASSAEAAQQLSSELADIADQLRQLHTPPNTPSESEPVSRAGSGRLEPRLGRTPQS